MRRRIEQWLTADPRLRILSWAIVMLLCAASGWIVVIHPGNQMLDQQRISYAARVQEFKQEQRKGRELETQITTAQRNLPLLEIDTFSAVVISKLPGVALVKWQPEGAQAELVLRSQWQYIPALFNALARTDIQLQGFSLVPDDGALMLTIRLEARP